MNNSITLGVDIGGSHITAAWVDLETKGIIQESKVRNHVNATGSADGIIETWVGAITKALQTRMPSDKKLAIAIPGPFEYESGVSLMREQGKYDALYGLNVKNLLADALQLNENNILFKNDAECFLKGELFCGAAKDAKRAIGLTLGTGLGSAMYDNGKVEDADLWRSPFLEDIAEEYLSTRWFIKRSANLFGLKIENVKDLAELKQIDARDKIFNEFGENLALFLNPFILSTEPEVVVLGGNIANSYNLFGASLHKNLVQIPSKVSLHQSALGEDSGLIGAASSWI